MLTKSLRKPLNLEFMWGLTTKVLGTCNDDEELIGMIYLAYIESGVLYLVSLSCFDGFFWV
jgi:hypothetical protein